MISSLSMPQSRPDSWAPTEFPVHKDWGVAPNFAFLVSSQVILTQLMQGHHHEDESSEPGGSSGEAVTTQNCRDPEGEREPGREAHLERRRLLVEAGCSFQEGGLRTNIAAPLSHLPPPSCPLPSTSLTPPSNLRQPELMRFKGLNLQG